MAVRVCVRECVRACVRACVCMYVYMYVCMCAGYDVIATTLLETSHRHLNAILSRSLHGALHMLSTYYGQSPLNVFRVYVLSSSPIFFHPNLRLLFRRTTRTARILLVRRPPPGAKFAVVGAGSPFVLGYYQKNDKKFGGKPAYEKINTDPNLPYAV